MPHVARALESQDKVCLNFDCIQALDCRSCAIHLSRIHVDKPPAHLEYDSAGTVCLHAAECNKHSADGLRQHGSAREPQHSEIVQYLGVGTGNTTVLQISPDKCFKQDHVEIAMHQAEARLVAPCARSFQLAKLLVDVMMLCRRPAHPVPMSGVVCLSNADASISNA